MPTSETRTQASMTMPLSSTRSRTSMRLLLLEARSITSPQPFRRVGTMTLDADDKRESLAGSSAQLREGDNLADRMVSAEATAKA